AHQIKEGIAVSRGFKFSRSGLLTGDPGTSNHPQSLISVGKSCVCFEGRNHWQWFRGSSVGIERLFLGCYIPFTDGIAERAVESKACNKLYLCRCLCAIDPSVGSPKLVIIKRGKKIIGLTGILRVDIVGKAVMIAGQFC